MKLSRLLSLTLILVLVSSLNIYAQLFEDFESGDKSFYGGASVTLSSGDWYFEESLLGNLSNDNFNGSQGVRMDRRDGVDTYIEMQFDKANGADEISFYMANYGSTSGNTILVQYSTDGGSNWTSIGEPIEATSNDLEQVTLKVEVDGNIRFKLVQGGSERLNIDDLLITDFVQAQDEATLLVTSGVETLSDDGSITFPKTLVGTNRTETLTIKNVGNTDLSISSVATTGLGFSVTDLTDSTLAFNESTSVTLTYEPIASGEAQGTFVVSSNATNVAEFNLTLSGEAFEDGDIIPIADARELPLGTRVSVTGRVTVANEFGGPLYMQDATAGIAVFWSDLHAAAEIGDSISVTGPLNVFKPIAGADSDFLLQISATDTDNNMWFEVFDVEKREVTPKPVTLAQVNAGTLEAQLVQIANATIDHSGVFQANTNYTISDNTGDAELRIDNNTNLVNVSAPVQATNVVGVVGKFAGINQLLPRFTEDLDVEEVTFPGDSISKDQTFDIVTWNVEWFGDAGNGPEDDSLQFENVKEVITTLDADVYALQEIANTELFADLDDALTDYRSIIATFSQTQKTAFLYKSSTVQMRAQGLITSGMNSSDWANGRFPLMFRFNATINGEVRDIYAYNIHAKAFGEDTDYSQRVNASIQLKTYLDDNRADDNVIILGDFNDEMLASTYNSEPSPYKNFQDDPEYTVVTKSLEEAGYTSYSSYSMIDHIIFTSELSDEHYAGTQRVENPFYIGSYLSQTSDHFPVWTRFVFGEITANENDNEIAQTFKLHQNYPNPFNPSTVINYELSQSTNVVLEVFDIAGRKISTLVNAKQSAGKQSVTFNAGNLSSGVYIYRLHAGGQILTKKMMLIK